MIFDQLNKFLHKISFFLLFVFLLYKFQVFLVIEFNLYPVADYIFIFYLWTTNQYMDLIHFRHQTKNSFFIIDYLILLNDLYYMINCYMTSLKYNVR